MVDTTARISGSVVEGMPLDLAADHGLYIISRKRLVAWFLP
jgi:hypothetical protein